MDLVGHDLVLTQDHLYLLGRQRLLGHLDCLCYSLLHLDRLFLTQEHLEIIVRSASLKQKFSQKVNIELTKTFI